MHVCVKFLPKWFTIIQEITFLTSEIFPILTRSAWTLKITMLNKSGYFRTPPSMIESTALDFWRKSKKPEIESYIIDHDFRKIQVKNTGSYWILPYIYIFLEAHASLELTVSLTPSSVCHTSSFFIKSSKFYIPTKIY